MTTYPPFDQRDYLTPDEIDALAVCDWYSDGEGYAAFIAFDNHWRRPDEHQSADYEVCVHPDCVAARAAERKAYVEWQDAERKAYVEWQDAERKRSASDAQKITWRRFIADADAVLKDRGVTP